MSRLEKVEEKEILKWCKLNRILFIKFTPFGERGWPDRIAIFPGGFHVWVELKRRGKVPTKLQEHRAWQLSKQGAFAVWFDNATDCIDYLNNCLEAATEVMDGVGKDTDLES